MKHYRNICFISNYSFTYLFHQIAEELKKEGIKTNWIVTNKKLLAYLQERYPQEQLLYISRKDFKGDRPAVDDFKLNEIIYGDRVLRYEPENGLKYLQNIQQPIYKFLKENKVKAVFSELTWGHEVLVHRICKKRPELNCTYLNPHVIRIPDNRFTFFTDERQSKIFEVERDLPFFGKIEPKKPDYLRLNDKKMKKGRSFKGRFKRALRFFTNENMEWMDPTLIVNQKWRFLSRFREELNRVLYSGVKRVPFNLESSKPYVFVALHRQPEATIDVFGRYYEDQLQNIKNLWRALPQGWRLLVKEHTNAIGDRSPKFYKTLNALPSVEVVEETADSYQIIKNAELVVTVTGTVAYEAALMGVPSVTFAPTFFNRLNCCRQIQMEDLNQYLLSDIVADLKGQSDNRAAFSQFLIQNSYEGKCYSPHASIISLEKENVENLSAGFKIAIDKLTEMSLDLPLNTVN